MAATGQSTLLGQTLGMRVVGAQAAYARIAMPITDGHRQYAGLVHAAAIAALADTAVGVGTLASLPLTKQFTTIELKINYLRAARTGTLHAEARLLHGGRTTQVWEADVRDDENRSVSRSLHTQLVIPVDDVTEPGTSAEIIARARAAAAG